MRSQQPYVSVKMHLAQNTLGGVGVSVLAAIVAVFVFGAPLLIVAPYALAGGAAVFGLFSITRAFGDEVEWMVRIATEKYAAYRNNSEVETLRIQLRIAQHDLEKAKNGDAPDDASVMLQTAHRMYYEHFSRGLPVSYESCMKRRLCSRGTWDHIHQLSVAARIKNDNGQVTARTFDDAWSKFCTQFATSNRLVRSANGSWVPAAPRHLLPSPRN